MRRLKLTAAAVAAAAALTGLALLAGPVTGPAMAAGGENQRGSEATTAAEGQHGQHPRIESQAWSFSGPLGTYDRASAQRGFQVYKEVCSNCHSMKLVYYRNLRELGFTEDEVKAIAASVQVPGGFDDNGSAVERPGLPSDHFRSPFPNDRAARAANNGALPPDQSLIIKARENGPNYVYALLNGYRDPPQGTTVPDGQYYNLYYPGNFLSMSPPLHADQVTYADGTPATLEQEARDVVQFLTWASMPELEARKRMGVKVGLFLVIMTGLAYAVKRKIWKDVH